MFFSLLLVAAFLLALTTGIAWSGDFFRARPFLVLLLGVSLLLIGMNLQSRWFFLISSLLVAALLVSLLLARWSVSGVEVKRWGEPEVMEGEPLSMELTVKNKGRLPRRFLLLDDAGFNERFRHEQKGHSLRFSLRASSMEAPSVAEGAVPPNYTVTLYLPLLPPGKELQARVSRIFCRRGIYTGGMVSLQSGGWLGLCPARKRRFIPTPVAVLPRYVELSSIPCLDSFLNHRKLRTEQSKRGHSLDFYGVREYQQGDPLRHIHWRSTARHGQLIVREFERETGSLFSILLHNPRGCDLGPPGDSILDCEARIGASLLHYALSSGHPTRIAYAERGSFLIHEVLSLESSLLELAALEDEGELEAEEMLALAGEDAPAGSALIAILPSLRFNLAAALERVPPSVQVIVVLLDLPSFASQLPSDAVLPSEEIEAWISFPPPGLSALFLFRKGDEIERCLSEPLLITSA